MRRIMNELQIERAAKNARTSIECEVVTPSEKSEELGKEVLRGELSESKAIEQIMERYTNQAERKVRP